MIFCGHARSVWDSVGGEKTHAFINELKIRVRGVNNLAEKIRILMKEHMTIVCPRLQSVIQSGRQQTK